MRPLPAALAAIAACAHPPPDAAPESPATVAVRDVPPTVLAEPPRIPRDAAPPPSCRAMFAQRFDEKCAGSVSFVHRIDAPRRPEDGHEVGWSVGQRLLRAEVHWLTPKLTRPESSEAIVRTMIVEFVVRCGEGIGLTAQTAAELWSHPLPSLAFTSKGADLEASVAIDEIKEALLTPDPPCPSE